jgi:PAS domain S-box-containing protein
MFNFFSRFKESHAAEIANALPLGIAIANEAGALVFVNVELERMTGYAPGELLGQTVDQLLPEKLRAGHAAHRAGFVAAPAQRLMGEGRDLFARRKDATEFPVEVGLKPMQTPLGPVTVASIIDVSQRQQMDASFRTIVEAAPYGIMLSDDQGRIALANDNLCAMFGYERAELLGEPIEMLVPERHQADHVAHRDGFARARSQRSMGSGRELTGLRKDGREIPVEIGLTSVMTAMGRMAFAAVVDITHRKRDELRLQEANAQLEEFTYVSSHDLRVPIRGVVSLLDWVREDLGASAPESVMRNLDRMTLRLVRIEKLIEDLLAYARSGRHSTKMEKIQLTSLIQEIVELEPVPAGMKLEVAVGEVSLEGARIPLQTVLRNLYANAIKHNDKPDGTVVIRARDEGNFSVISVIDDGPGIPEQAQTRVFRLFQTLTSSERKGSGLGLAVAKRLAESHGGKIELTSVSERPGCTFDIWWPKFMRSDLDD